MLPFSQNESTCVLSFTFMLVNEYCCAYLIINKTIKGKIVCSDSDLINLAYVLSSVTIKQFKIPGGWGEGFACELLLYLFNRM